MPANETPLWLLESWRQFFKHIIDDITTKVTFKQERADRIERAVNALNSQIDGRQDLRLLPRIEYRYGDTTPSLSLQPNNLYGYMLMEMSLMLVGGGQLLICEQCGNVFVSGAGTAKRSHAKYCHNRCRVAATRARKRAELPDEPIEATLARLPKGGPDELGPPIGK